MIPHLTEQREGLHAWLVSDPRILIGCDFDGTISPWDKGTALHWFMSRCQVDSSATASWKMTDRDAFRELPDGWTFVVGNEVNTVGKCRAARSERYGGAAGMDGEGEVGGTI